MAGAAGLRLPVWHLDVFGRGPGGGNPCPVGVNADGLSDAQMQALAAELGQEMAFALRDGDGGLRLRFFVPRREVGMCVHATVAAVTVLLRVGALTGSEVCLRTTSGECHVTWDDSDPPRVSVEQQLPRFGSAFHDAAAVEQAVGLTSGAVNRRLPVRAVDVSRPKLIVPVRTADAVQGAQPDLPQLWSFCRRLATTGAYLFAPHPDGRPAHFVARQFPVDAGFPEDPATGIAAAALAAYLADLAPRTASRWIPVEIDQGDAMGRPSLLHASALVDIRGVLRSTVTGQALLRDRHDLDLMEFVARRTSSGNLR